MSEIPIKKINITGPDTGKSRDNCLPFADNKDKVSTIMHNLEVLKSMLAEVVSDCEDKKGEEDFVDTLAEALESMDDAIDALSDAVSA